jgi:hypothetical protein
MRVPEMAPALGRLIVPRRSEPLWIPLDDIADDLATRVIELGGEARRLAESGTPDRILDALGRSAWLAAWEHAVRRTAERAASALDDAIARAARRVRMPEREWRRLLLSLGERRAITARFGSGAERFVAALDALTAAAARVREASVLDKEAHLEWQEALRTAARRLEAAWLALEEELGFEAKRWEPEIERVEAWRPSLWRVLVLWVPLAVVLVWLGLVLGGYLPAPLWLAVRLGF